MVQLLNVLCGTAVTVVCYAAVYLVVHSSNVFCGVAAVHLWCKAASRVSWCSCHVVCGAASISILLCSCCRGCVVPHICFLVQLLHVRGASTVLQLLHLFSGAIAACGLLYALAQGLQLCCSGCSTSYFYGAGAVADSDGSTAIPLMLSL
jgi:hypothetical protein